MSKKKIHHRNHRHHKNQTHKSVLKKAGKGIQDFLIDEEGKITKKNIVKMGTSLALLAMALTPPEQLMAQHTSHSSHSNAFYESGHTSSTTHANTHANHGNHSSGTWC